MPTQAEYSKVLAGLGFSRVIQDVDKVELETIGIGEEHRIVAWLIAVLSGWVEHLGVAL